MDSNVAKTLRELQSAGWDARKETSISFNSGSETLAHAQCKFLTGWCYHERGFRVNSEVEMDKGEVDILAYNAEESIVVECETSPTDDVVSDKINRYVFDQPPRECFILNVNEMPLHALEGLGWVKDQL